MTDPEEPKLPNPGKNRFWVIKHQPQKKTMPLRIELRERTIKDQSRNVIGFSRILGFEETVADRLPVRNAATKVVIRAGHADRFVGIWNGESE